MTRSLDKIDVAEELVELLDDQIVGVLGHVLASFDSEDFSSIVLQTWPIAGEPSVDFILRVRRLKS